MGQKGYLDQRTSSSFRLFVISVTQQDVRFQRAAQPLFASLRWPSICLNIVSMSRLTSAQVIGLGEYLEPDFEPTTLTVSQLLGVLGYHNVRYPTPYSKPKLVLLFNEEIKTRASKFKKERLKKENSIASDDGIVDGVTGQPLGATRKVLEIRMASFCYLMSFSNSLETLPARRSSRRFSQVPADVLQQPPDPVHLPVSWLS